MGGMKSQDDHCRKEQGVVILQIIDVKATREERWPSRLATFWLWSEGGSADQGGLFERE